MSSTVCIQLLSRAADDDAAARKKKTDEEAAAKKKADEEAAAKKKKAEDEVAAKKKADEEEAAAKVDYSSMIFCLCCIISTPNCDLTKAVCSTRATRCQRCNTLCALHRAAMYCNGLQLQRISLCCYISHCHAAGSNVLQRTVLCRNALQRNCCPLQCSGAASARSE